MKIAVIGTGYVGLVTGSCLAEVGHDVTCVDIDKAKIQKLQQGELPIYEPGLPGIVLRNQATRRLRFTSQLVDIDQPEVIFFALPTPPTAGGEADLSFVLSAAKDVAKHLKQYTVLVNKSTVPVGTAAKVRAAVEAAGAKTFDVVSNPEFLREGFAVTDFMQADRIVVGSSSGKALAVMRKLYQPLTNEGVPLIAMDEASAELTKYAANSFLVTKISFMNEIANLCELVGADVDKVREGIGADERIGHRFLHAGIGYGGSCFPKDILALLRVAEQYHYDFKVLKAVMAVNARQKKVLIEKVTAAMGENLAGKTLALWGLAFKPDTDDVREAPSLEIIRELLNRGAKIQAYDPEAMANARRHFPTEITYSSSAEAALEGADALVIVTEWKVFQSADPALLKEKLHDKLIFDGRNIFNPAAMAKAGLRYHSIGRPNKT